MYPHMPTLPSHRHARHTDAPVQCNRCMPGIVARYRSGSRTGGLSGAWAASALMVFSLWLGAIPGAHALNSDRKQPINIKADRVHLDEHKGVSTYSGHVEMTQGSIVLSAGQITVYQTAGRLKRIEAEGKPARFSQLPDNSPHRITADADHMEYLADSSQLILTGQARVTQGGNLFSGHHIEYDTLHSTVSARKDAQGDQGRVHAVIQPARPTPLKEPTKTPMKEPVKPASAPTPAPPAAPAQ